MTSSPSTGTAPEGHDVYLLQRYAVVNANEFE